MNNPVKYIDPNGRSTHIGLNGQIHRVFDDEDLGVYVHSDGYNEDLYQSGKMESIGESLHALSFADQSEYHNSGKIIPNKRITLYPLSKLHLVKLQQKGYHTFFYLRNPNRRFY